MDCHHNNREKAHLLSVVGKLESEFQAVKDYTKTFEEALSGFQDDQIQTDLQNIETAIECFNQLIGVCYASGEEVDLLDAEYLREMRHDLRAAVGGVVGYVELIQEVLEDLEAPSDVLKMAVYLHKIASHILQSIEEFVVRTAEAEAPEGGDLSEYFQDILIGKILIVDDSLQKRDLLSRKLEKMGHETYALEDGNLALEYLAQNHADLILLDLFMPEMNGDEVLQKLKSDERLKETPVLVISSSSDMDNVIKCIRLGADDYLPMPVNNTLLHARINACLTKKFAQDREHKTLQDLAEARQRLSSAIENIDEGFAVFNSEDQLTICNTRFVDLYPSVKSLGGIGFSYEDFVRENIKQNLYGFERRGGSSMSQGGVGETPVDDWVSMKISYHQNPTRPHVELLSSGMWIEVIENKIPGGGIVSVHKDISEGKKKEKRLEYLALHDGLTGLANRKNFDEALSALVEQAQMKGYEAMQFGVVFFDLDGFKNVNDTLGHDFGDFLLQSVATGLTENIRDTDLVARLGGDEFAALVLDLESEEDMVQLAERCLMAIGTQVEKDGQVADFGVSIGISMYPKNAKTGDELLKKADTAMYEAKKAGKGTYRLAS